MNFVNQYNTNYNNKLIINLLKKFKIYNDNEIISLYQIRLLICILVKYNHNDILKNLFNVLFKYDNNIIIKLLLYYKNKIAISKENFKKIISKEDKLNLYINFQIENKISEKYNYYFTKCEYVCYKIDETVTSLHTATFYVSMKAMKLLINYGADLNIKNNKGETAFFLNCKISNCNHGVPYILYRNGANPFIKDNEGNTALYIYSKYLGIYKNIELNVLDFLLSIGFDINERNKNGKTPLMELCHLNNTHTVYYFIKKGAYVFIKDKDGNTALNHFGLRLVNDNNELDLLSFYKYGYNDDKYKENDEKFRNSIKYKSNFRPIDNTDTEITSNSDLKYLDEFRTISRLCYRKSECYNLFKYGNPEYSLIKESDDKFHFIVT
ncbi:ankyrin [Anaeromyces robustus]|uniref:Ankyrin n=1 Tax=Anaeromyces robustus TaxID=1754192 RepID=A0A1Y1VSJ7_9FUNG|nr:ankyrin [Anaeromyces robustus]|eukprot:ORX64259.1 ankyrin [Anaeromyces robustus]